MNAADEYLVTGINKSLGSLLETLDAIKADVMKIDAAAIAESERRINPDGTDWLVLTHEKMEELTKGLATWRLALIIFSTLGGKSVEVD